MSTVTFRLVATWDRAGVPFLIDRIRFAVCTPDPASEGAGAKAHPWRFVIGVRGFVEPSVELGVETAGVVVALRFWELFGL